MFDIHYLLSDRFDYGKMIHADAGPNYARRHRWAIDSVARLRELVAHGPTLIDNRVTEEEMASLAKIIRDLAPAPVYVKVVDPYWPCIAQPYYRWLLTLTRFPHVCFLGPYQPTALTGVLVELAGCDAYLQLPYAYENERELPHDPTCHSKFLVVSGAQGDVYPERAALVRALRRHRWAARHVTVLPHPGYPDVGQTAKHGIVGDSYIRYIAGYRFMYVEPSAERLEFLKYTECAYAGCVPVGRAPATFPETLRECIVSLESGNLVADLRALAGLNADQVAEAARVYRDRLRIERNVDRLNTGLAADWHERGARLQAQR